MKLRMELFRHNPLCLTWNSLKYPDYVRLPRKGPVYKYKITSSICSMVLMSFLSQMKESKKEKYAVWSNVL